MLSQISNIKMVNIECILSVKNNLKTYIYRQIIILLKMSRLN